MIGEVIQEYLVALGAKIDKPGFREMDQTIQQSGELITRATGSWAANFVKASTIIASAIAGVKAATLGLMTAAAKQDLEMEKYARSMMMSRDAAEQMKRATDALGESINDITLSPELSERFRELSADGSQMLVGGDFKETMRNFRDLIFQWTRLKQEASYAMTWIGYYLAKYLQKPLAEIRERFREFNDNFVKNISTWTEKAARAIVYILEIGRHFLTFLWDVGKALYNIWDSFPKGVKIATAALAGFWMIMRASPLGRMIALVSMLMLLIDDYYGYMEGKNAALGPLWDKLNDAIERGKELWEEIVPVLESVCEQAVEIAQAFWQWIVEMSQDESVRAFMDSVVELGKAVWELGKEIWNFISGALSAIFEGFGENETVYSFGDSLREVLAVASLLNKWMTKLAKSIREVFKTVGDSQLFKQFWKSQGQYAREFYEIIKKVLGALGKVGQALLVLMTEDNKLTAAKKAVSLLGDAWDIATKPSGNPGGGMFGGIGRAAMQFGANLGRSLGFGSSQIASEAWTEAQRIGAQYNVDPALIYGQWYHETEGFTSDLAMNHFNLGGLTQESYSAGMEQPDGGNYYMQFGSVREFADYYGRHWGEDIQGSRSAAEMAKRLQINGYYTADYDEYRAGIENGMYNTPEYGGGGGTWESTNGGGGNWGGSIFDNPNLEVMDDVSVDGATDETLAMLNCAGEIYRQLFPDMGKLWISAVTNGGHAEGSGHYLGEKGDVGGDAFEIGGEYGLTEEQAMRNRDVFTQALLALGIGANDEYTYPSAGSTGGHFDLDSTGTVWNDSQYNGEYGGFNSGWGAALNKMRDAFASYGFTPGGKMSTPPYMSNVGNTATVTIGDINVTIEGGANASAEELGRAFSDQVSAFFQPYGMALAGNNV